MPIHKLYPKVQFPVSVGTPMISSLIQKGWDHTDDWFVPKFDDKSLLQITGQQFHVSLSEEEFRFISGHKIGSMCIKYFIYYMDYKIISFYFRQKNLSWYRLFIYGMGSIC